MRGTIILLLAICLALTGGKTEEYERDLSGTDVFRAVNIKTFGLKSDVVEPAHRYRGHLVRAVYGPSEMDKLEDYLEKNTNSEDPLENLNIIVESLISGYKNNDASGTPSTEARRLVAALSTLKGENLCNYYGFRITENNLSALDMDMEAVRERRSTRRLHKILEHFIHERIKNCGKIYFNKFDELSTNLDETMMSRLDALLKGAVETLTSKASESNQDKSYVERLFLAAAHGVSVDFTLQPSYIYEAIKDSVESGLKDVPIVQDEPDTESGSNDARKRKLGQIFDEMVSKPCRYFRERFGPDVFEPALFDGEISNEFESNRVDFYEALVKYRFCSLDSFYRESLRDRFVAYVEDGSRQN